MKPSCSRRAASTPPVRRQGGERKRESRAHLSQEVLNRYRPVRTKCTPQRCLSQVLIHNTTGGAGCYDDVLRTDPSLRRSLAVLDLDRRDRELRAPGAAPLHRRLPDAVTARLLLG